MIILLPLILVLVLLGALRGGTNLVLVLPMLLTLAAGAVFMMIAERDMRGRRDRSVRVLRTSHLRRTMRSALRPEPTRRSTRKAPSISARGPHRRPGPRRLPD